MTLAQRTSIAAVLLLAGPLPSVAQVLATSDATIRDQLCVGFSCANDPTGGFPESLAGSLMLYDQRARIDFVDSSVFPGYPTNDWALLANDVSLSGQDYFAIQDSTAGVIPFRVMAGAPESALFVGANGAIGMGTSLPQDELHIVSNASPFIRLETVASRTPYIWVLGAGGGSMGFLDVTGGFTVPFYVETGAPEDALAVKSDGKVGIGTPTPGAPLEIVADDTFSFFRITASGAPVNQSADITFTQGPVTTGELRYNIVDGDGPEMRLNADGDMTLTGTLTTAGPTCGAGCDRVFAPDYDISSVEEHAAAMWAAGHLPAVGPTEPGAPLDLSERMGTMLNELEHAHIYIAELHGENRALHARLAAQEAEAGARLAEQERLNAALLAQVERQSRRLDALETATAR